MDNKFYTVRELAELLKLSEKTVIRIIKSGGIEAYKIGNAWRISSEALEEYLHANSNKSN